MNFPDRVRSLTASCVLLGSALAAPVSPTGTDAEGITVRRGAVVLFGSAANCSQPGSVRFKKLQRKTSEWRTIRLEGVRRGTARHDLLTARMNERIRRAAGRAADERGCDCVVRKRDIVDDRGMTVRDLTDDVAAQLDQVTFGTP